jgi:hypothetical protein
LFTGPPKSLESKFDMWKLREIQPLTKDTYQVLFDTEEGDVECVVCRVVAKGGAMAVQPTPDIFMGKKPPPVNSREVAAAVIAFHTQKRSGI